MKLSKSTKKKIIGAFILIITTAIILFIKGCFDSKIPSSQKTFIGDNKVLISKDSSIQIEKIENSGNLSIGQKGGAVNQTTIVT